ncbi:hypothetical protein SARC_05736 [Sphaeroforma arctica JP610]|uniref:Uncharacterized protein n=1 Tax=Sphaeroforma arctica JP610 TaxID=667725 RepID=A0A0L0FYP6_9EUKA|nr:hypothetical protein SARC_05736 [Sphaeroforma arctica JP610]KNC81972.1 hypothetical protein SARC_05736 [Sphaeroforma arctica JP610]|eukprot:XP_014155874.1 hypothetical protein SARC_05736 [Sphaeroforma arctica JP610]
MTASSSSRTVGGKIKGLNKDGTMREKGSGGANNTGKGKHQLDAKKKSKSQLKVSDMLDHHPDSITQNNVDGGVNMVS